MPERFFRSSGYLQKDEIACSDGSTFSIEALPRFLRTLLVADGTVTKSLESWFWEPVKITPRSQAKIALTEPLEILSAVQGTEVLRREVCLTGKNSGKNYACARSMIILQSLPEETREGLLEGRIGIGELLRKKGVETYREIVALDYIKKAAAKDELLRQFKDDLVSRSYRIRVEGAPAILVTEYFPPGLYAEN